jgi:hypothetical protein
MAERGRPPAKTPEEPNMSDGDEDKQFRSLACWRWDHGSGPRTLSGNAPCQGLGTQASAHGHSDLPGRHLVLGGGVNAGLHSGKAPQQGIHLTGRFPSNAGGTMVTTSGSATSWASRAETGGQSAPNTETTAFAVCAVGQP